MVCFPTHEVICKIFAFKCITNTASLANLLDNYDSTWMQHLVFQLSLMWVNAMFSGLQVALKYKIHQKKFLIPYFPNLAIAKCRSHNRYQSERHKKPLYSFELTQHHSVVQHACRRALTSMLYICQLTVTHDWLEMQWSAQEWGRSSFPPYSQLILHQGQ